MCTKVYADTPALVDCPNLQRRSVSSTTKSVTPLSLCLSLSLEAVMGCFVMFLSGPARSEANGNSSQRGACLPCTVLRALIASTRRELQQVRASPCPAAPLRSRVWQLHRIAAAGGMPGGGAGGWRKSPSRGPFHSLDTMGTPGFMPRLYSRGGFSQTPCVGAAGDEPGCGQSWQRGSPVHGRQQGAHHAHHHPPRQPPHPQVVRQPARVAQRHTPRHTCPARGPGPPDQHTIPVSASRVLCMQTRTHHATARPGGVPPPGPFKSSRGRSVSRKGFWQSNVTPSGALHGQSMSAAAVCLCCGRCTQGGVHDHRCRRPPAGCQLAGPAEPPGTAVGRGGGAGG